MVDLRCDGMAHASELIAMIRRAQLPFREVPVQIHYTSRSLAKGQRAGSALRIAVDYLLGRVLR